MRSTTDGDDGGSAGRGAASESAGGGVGAIDPLTGRRKYGALTAALEQAVVAAGQSGGAVSLGVVDIDLFGRINQESGREVGDAVLVGVVNGLSRAVGDRGEVFRYGGDSFGVLLDGFEKEQAFLLMEGARSAVEGKRRFEASEECVEVDVAVCVGIASFPDDGSSVQDILRKANEALYRAKVSGRNRVCLAREEKMITKTSHYGQGQLQGLSRLAKRMGVGEAELLREALDDLLRKYNA